MVQQGIVVDMDEHYVYASVKQSGACDGCHKTDSCAECASTLTVKAHNDCGAGIGDKVEIEASTSRVLLYAFFVFILPFAPAAAAYFLVRSAVDGEFLPIFAAVAVLALFFLLLHVTLDRRAEKRCDRRASKILEKAPDTANGEKNE